METAEIRERFLSFFEERGHERFDSDSLVPSSDPTLLFTSAGMNQFKEYFMNPEDAPISRATSCQKCFRTGDIENVGKTRHHLTFFEMLGNFSFGDYFKEQAILWGWEFVTEELQLDPDRLLVSVFKDDDQAYEIWEQKVGVPEERIYRFGEGENFWPANVISEGPNTPCGPCSEIHYDLGPEQGCGKEDCDLGCCDRYSELYNLVFMQYQRKDGGELDPLPEQNIDTGMGLERVAAIMQDAPNVFETSHIFPIVQHASELLDTPYESGSSRSDLLRRITEHIRASVFLISDNILPSNEGRGYVERKILRRAIDAAVDLGAESPVLWKLVDTVVTEMSEVYPSLADCRESAENIIRSEEKKYLRTLDRGRDMLNSMLQEMSEDGREILSGENAFLLYDTYGFPIEKTKSIVEDEGKEVDMEGFQEEMEKQRERARQQTTISSDIFGDSSSLTPRELPRTDFTGYYDLEDRSEVLSLTADGEIRDELTRGDEGALVLERTPFYAEAGGQIGDQGRITSPGGTFEVHDTQKHQGIYVHQGQVTEGRLQAGELASCSVRKERRQRIATHHSCTHILQAILRDELGTHVQQAGSLVADDHLRFDFTHPDRLNEETLHQIEHRANKRIMEQHPVNSSYTTMEEARKRGALMFFGEEYDNIVRLVEIGDFSLELCGGTHIRSTREASFFKITKERSVASGVRRIEAVCGESAVKKLLERDAHIQEICRMLSTTPEKLPERIGKLQDEIKSLQRELEQARQVSTADLLETLEDEKEQLNGITVVVHNLEEVNQDQLRPMADDLIENRSTDVALLSSTRDNKVSMVLKLRPNLQEEKGLNAETIIRNVADVVGGGGGGRADFAEAGGPDTGNIDQALKKFQDILVEEL